LENIDDENSVIENITQKKYQLLKADQIIHSGMIPKIDNCFDALSNGVTEVKIGAPEMISGNTLTISGLKKSKRIFPDGSEIIWMNFRFPKTK
jgi:acetylglutamate kinase